MSSQKIPNTLAGKALTIQFYLDCYNLYHNPTVYHGSESGDWLLKTAESIKPIIDEIVSSLTKSEITEINGLISDDNLTLETDYPSLAE